MKKVAKEFYRVLKPGKYAAILIGIPDAIDIMFQIAFRVMKIF